MASSDSQLQHRVICGWNFVNALTFDGDGDRLFSADTGWLIRGIDLNDVPFVDGSNADAQDKIECTRDVKHLEMSGSAGSIHRISFHPESGRLASVGDDELIRIWNTQTGTQVTALPGHFGTITHVEFLNDPGDTDGGLSAISISRDRTAQKRKIFRNLDELTSTVCNRLESIGLQFGQFCFVLED